MTNLIQPYNPDWKTEFENLKQVLCIALQHFKIAIEHIGSTAIPGLCAKPILDIDIVLKDTTLLADISAILEKLGYNNRGEQGIKGRFAFRQSTGTTPLTTTAKKWQEHHLYICFADSLALKNHLLVRNALLQNDELVQEYAQLKLALSQEKGITREQYTQQKTDFIITVLAQNGLDERALSDIKKANL